MVKLFAIAAVLAAAWPAQAQDFDGRAAGSEPGFPAAVAAPRAPAAAAAEARKNADASASAIEGVICEKEAGGERHSIELSRQKDGLYVMKTSDSSGGSSEEAAYIPMPCRIQAAEGRFAGAVCRMMGVLDLRFAADPASGLFKVAAKMAMPGLPPAREGLSCRLK